MPPKSIVRIPGAHPRRGGLRRHESSGCVMHGPTLCGSAVALVCALHASATQLHGQGTIDIIAFEGGTPLTGNGTFSIFGFPELNNAGQVAFFARLTGTDGGTNDDEGIFRSSNLDELDDSNFTAIRRKIGEEINKVLQKSYIHDVFIIEYNRMEQ